VWLVLSAPARAQTVRVDFDEWPDAPCTAPAMAQCEDAWVEAMPTDPLDMVVQDCGLRRCLRVGWTADQSVRRVRTPWAPPAGTQTAYLELRMRFQDFYIGSSSSTGWLSPHYQPLARLHGEDPAAFGIDLGVVHLRDRPPVMVLASAPGTATSNAVRFDQTDATCALELPGSGFLTIQAGVSLGADGNDRCQLTIDGVASIMAGLSFGGDAFASASFLGRVSNDSPAAQCDPGWPPCGGNERRGIIVDSLCVSDRIEAGGDGSCAPDGATTPPPGDSGAPPGVSFRGGGCECDTASPPGADAWTFLLSILLFGLRGRRRGRRLLRVE
jgi:hypothetical protein